MQTRILLSIKPEFAEAIFSGMKRFEFRRAIFRQDQIEKVYVYASRPICMVIGEFEVEKILSSNPRSLWKTTKQASGISKKYFDEYFDGRKVAHAMKISSPRRYNEPLSLLEMFSISRPPQSFMYV